MITPLGAFLGAIATIAAVYFLGRREGQLDSTTLLLGGIISASFLSAIIMFLMTTLAGRDLRGMVFWLMGDLSTPVPAGLRWIFTVGLLGRHRRDLYDRRRFESACLPASARRFTWAWTSRA